MASTNGGRRGGPIWSKPHPHQSLNHAKISVSDHHGPPVPPPRQPLQMANRITTLYDILPLLSNDIELSKEVVRLAYVGILVTPFAIHWEIISGLGKGQFDAIV